VTETYSRLRSDDQFRLGDGRLGCNGELDGHGTTEEVTKKRVGDEACHSGQRSNC